MAVDIFHNSWLSDQTTRLASITHHLLNVDDVRRQAAAAYAKDLAAAVPSLHIAELTQSIGTPTTTGNPEVDLAASLRAQRQALKAAQSNFASYVVGAVPDYTFTSVSTQMEEELRTLTEKRMQPFLDAKQALFDKAGIAQITATPTKTPIRGESLLYTITDKKGNSITVQSLDPKFSAAAKVAANQTAMENLAQRQALADLLGVDPANYHAGQVFGDPSTNAFISTYQYQKLQFDDPQAALREKAYTEDLAYIRSYWKQVDADTKAGLSQLRDSAQRTLDESTLTAAKTAFGANQERSKYIDSLRAGIAATQQQLYAIRRGTSKTITTGFKD